MDAIKAEIERKRKQVEKIQKDPKKKYYKRSEETEERNKQYLEKVAEKAAQNIINRKSVNLDAEHALDKLTEKEITNEKRKLTRPEVIRRLRERSQPIFLFGETEIDSFKRLRKLEIDEPDFKPGSKNDFQAALNAVEQEYLKEIIEGKGNQKKSDDKSKLDVNPLPDEKYEEFEDIKKQVDEFERGIYKVNCDIINSLMAHLVQRWANELNARPDIEKRSPHGRVKAGIFKQTHEFIKPLFKQLKERSINTDILMHLVNISKQIFLGDYIRANNAYMELAIGNAPWPVGATRTGIHIRPGQMKIDDKNIAHVLNDETQRKYVQAVKRLLTKCQEYYPSDPSKCVDYIPVEMKARDKPTFEDD